MATEANITINSVSVADSNHPRMSKPGHPDARTPMGSGPGSAKRNEYSKMKAGMTPQQREEVEQWKHAERIGKAMRRRRKATNRREEKRQKEKEKWEREWDKSQERQFKDQMRQTRERAKEQLLRAQQMHNEELKYFTLRRRLINDMFGAFNRAHLGRRVNHALDTAFAAAGADPRQRLLPRAVQGAATGGGLLGAGTMISRAITSQDGEGGRQSKSASAVQRTIERSIAAKEERINRAVRSSGDALAERYLKSGRRDSTGRVDKSTRTLHGGNWERHGLTKKGMGPYKTRVDMIGRHAQTLPKGLPKFAAPSTAQNLLPSATGAVVGGASAATGMSVAAGSALGGVLGLLAAPVVAAGAALGAMALGALAASAAAARMARSLENIPGPHMWESINQELLDLEHGFQRAARFGDQLAGVTREAGRGRRLGADLIDTTAGPLLDLQLTVLEGKNAIVQNIIPLMEKLMNNIGEPILDMIGTGVDYLVQILNALVIVMDAWAASDFGKWMKDHLNGMNSIMKILLGISDKPDDEELKRQANLMEEVFEWIGAPANNNALTPIFFDKKGKSRKVNLKIN